MENNLYIKQVIEHLNTDKVVNFYTEVGMPYVIKATEYNDYEIRDILDGKFIYVIPQQLEEILTALYYDKDTDTDIKPEYYQHRAISCKQLQESFEYNDNTDVPQIVSYYENNVLKYLYRYRMKNGKEDLIKARTYINFLIALYESPKGGDKDE